jgi:hypothetical protein
MQNETKNESWQTAEIVAEGAAGTTGEKGATAHDMQVEER